jgi:lipoprotein-anchoring transpeptidase ErfK/SrfK
MTITLLLIVLSTQTMQAYSGENLLFTTSVSTGKEFFETEPGWYRIERKDKDAISKKYPEATKTRPAGGAKMAWACFFSPDGKALHAGRIDQRSHGCVHLQHKIAEYVFEHSTTGTWVVVIQEIH